MSDIPPANSPEPQQPVPTPEPGIPPTTPVGATPTPAAAPGAPVVADAADIEKNKVMGVLAYIGILFLVPLLAAKDSPFARYHTNQGIILCISIFVVWVAVFIISFILAFVPVIGAIIGCFLFVIIFVGWIALTIMGIINAANGQMKPLPLIGNLFTLIK